MFLKKKALMNPNIVFEEWNNRLLRNQSHFILNISQCGQQCQNMTFIFFVEENVTGLSYKNLLEKQFFPAIKKQNAVDDYWFMQDVATPHRTKDVSCNA